MTNSKNEISIKNQYDLSKAVQMVEMAKVIKHHIVKNQLYTGISGKNYAHVEAWQFAGGLIGTFPRVSSVENLSRENEIKWKADVDIIEIKTGTVIGRGFALCSNKENKKRTFDEYAVLSMAQTRAIGKAYRNLIGWVIKLAGYEATPSEEMAKMGDTPSRSSQDQNDQPHKPKKGQKVGPDGEPTYVCSVTDDPITETEYEYSMKVYGRPLSREAQKNAKPIRN